MSQPLPLPDDQLPRNTVAIGRDGHRVSVVITCLDIAAALERYRQLCDEANETGFVTIDIEVVPRPTLDATQ